MLKFKVCTELTPGDVPKEHHPDTKYPACPLCGQTHGTFDSNYSNDAWRCPTDGGARTWDKLIKGFELVGLPFVYAGANPAFTVRSKGVGTPAMPVAVNTWLTPQEPGRSDRAIGLSISGVLYLEFRALPVRAPRVIWEVTSDVSHFGPGVRARYTRLRVTAQDPAEPPIATAAVITHVGDYALDPPLVLSHEPETINGVLAQTGTRRARRSIEIVVTSVWPLRGTPERRVVEVNGRTHEPTSGTHAPITWQPTLQCDGGPKLAGPPSDWGTEPTRPLVTIVPNADDRAHVSVQDGVIMVRRGKVLGYPFDLTVTAPEAPSDAKLGYDLQGCKVEYSAAGGISIKVKERFDGHLTVTLHAADRVLIERHMLALVEGDPLPPTNDEADDKPGVPVAVDVGTSKIVVAPISNSQFGTVRPQHRPVVLYRNTDGEVVTVHQDQIPHDPNVELVPYAKLIFGRMPRAHRVWGRDPDTLLAELVRSAVRLAERTWQISATKVLLSHPPAYRLTSRMRRWVELVGKALDSEVATKSDLMPGGTEPDEWAFPYFDEPIASYFAWYSAKGRDSTPEYTLIVDFGAGTTDVALIRRLGEWTDGQAPELELHTATVGSLSKDRTSFFSFSGADVDICVAWLISQFADAGSWDIDPADPLRLTCSGPGVDEVQLAQVPKWFNAWRTSSLLRDPLGYDDTSRESSQLLRFCEQVKRCLLSSLHTSSVDITLQSKSATTSALGTISRQVLLDTVLPGAAMVASAVAGLFHRAGIVRSDDDVLPDFTVVLTGQSYWEEWRALLQGLLSDTAKLRAANRQLVLHHPYATDPNLSASHGLVAWTKPSGTAGPNVIRYPRDNATVVADGLREMGQLLRFASASLTIAPRFHVERLTATGSAQVAPAGPLKQTGSDTAEFEVSPQWNSTGQLRLMWYLEHPELGSDYGEVLWEEGKRVVARLDLRERKTVVTCE